MKSRMAEPVTYDYRSGKCVAHFSIDYLLLGAEPGPTVAALNQTSA